MSHNLTKEFFENLQFMVNYITDLRTNLYNLSKNAKSTDLLTQKHLEHKKAMAIANELTTIINNQTINMKDLIHAQSPNNPAFNLLENIIIITNNTVKKIQEKAKKLPQHGNIIVELNELNKSIKNTQHNIIQLRNASNILNPNNIFTTKLDSLNHALATLLLTSNKITHHISNTTPNVTFFSDKYYPNKKKTKKLPEIPIEDQHKNTLHQRTTGRHNNK